MTTPARAPRGSLATPPNTRTPRPARDVTLVNRDPYAHIETPSSNIMSSQQLTRETSNNSVFQNAMHSPPDTPPEGLPRVEDIEEVNLRCQSFPSATGRPSVNENVQAITTVLKDCSAILTDSKKHISTFQGCNAFNKEGAGLKTDITEFENTEFYPRSHTGIVGERGSGKSTLINALLDCDVVIPTGEIGTCVPIPIEFRKLKESTAAKYQLELTYWSRDDVLASEVERLHQLFPNQRDNDAATLHDAVTVFYKNNHLSDNEYHTVIQDYDHPDEISQAIRDIMLLSNLSNGDLDTIRTWPLLHHICVRLNADILKSGVVLVDIPGLDEDYVQKPVTDWYISACQELVIVTTHGVILPGQNLKSLNEVGYEKTGIVDFRYRIHLVATFADELDEEDARAFCDVNEKYKVDMDYNHIRIKETTNKRVKTESDMGDLDSEKQNQNVINKRMLEAWVHSWGKRTFASRLNKSDLRIETFVVGTKDYLKRRDSESRFTSPGDNEFDEIDRLREHISRLSYPRFLRVAESRLREAASIYCHLNLWANRHNLPLSINERDRLSKRWKGPSQPGMIDILDQALEGLRNESKDQMKEVFDRLKGSIDKWVRETPDKCRDSLSIWKSRLAQSEHSRKNLAAIKSACKNFGVYSAGDGQTSIDLNEEFLHHLSTHLSQQWAELFQHLDGILGQYAIAVTGHLEQLLGLWNKSLREAKIPTANAQMLSKLMQTEVYHLRDFILAKIRDQTQSFRIDIRIANRKFSRTWDLSNLMSSIYEEATSKKGTRVGSRMVDHIADSIEENGIFGTLARSMHHDADTFTQDFENFLQTIQTDILTSLDDKLKVWLGVTSNNPTAPVPEISNHARSRELEIEGYIRKFGILRDLKLKDQRHPTLTKLLSECDPCRN